MAKQNCWEFMKCGRQPGGDNTEKLGECPVAYSFITHRVHDGMNGGRCCWAVAGTFCGGQAQGTFADKLKGCASCKFFHMVNQDEGGDFMTVQQIISKIRGVDK